MRRCSIILVLLGMSMPLGGCSESPEDAVSALADAWASHDVEAVIDLSADTVSANQRNVLKESMRTCTVDADSAVDVAGGTSDMVRAWALVADCEGTTSLLAGNMTTDNEDVAWKFSPAELPGGAHADFIPSALPTELKDLPKVGE